MSKPISIQLYSVREAMADDPWGTLKKIADMGYVGVEPTGVIANDLDTMVKCISDLGMVVSSYQAGQPTGDNANKLMDEAEALNCTRIVQPGSNHDSWKTMAGLDELAVGFNEAVENTAKRGMTFGYHNHDFEMVLVDGEVALLEMAKKAPGMHYTVDTYWVEVGGQSAVDIVTKLGDKASLLHVKDGPIENGRQSAMLAIGSGAMDFPPIVEAATAAEWLVVELDRCDTDMIEAVAKSADYLAESGLGHKRS